MRIQRIFQVFILMLLAFFLSSSSPLFAQIVVNTNDGGVITGSLGWAVTNINNAAGAISIGSTLGPITLTQPLATVSQDVTFQGTSSTVIGQSEAQAQFLFQQGFTLDSTAGLTFTNNGALSSGLDAAMTAASWTLSNNSSFSLSGAATTSQSGNAILTAGTGTAATASNFLIQGGAGTPGGGNGGSASVSFTALSMSGAAGTVAGGAGAGGTEQNGNGGSATLSLGTLNMDTGAQLGLTGGNGGVTTTGGLGNGGNAFLTAASVSLTGSNTQLNVVAGAGGMPLTISSLPGPAGAGNAGSAEVSAASVTVDSNAQLGITGGAGGSVLAASSGTGGIGGGATLVTGSLTLTNGGSLGVTAGAGGQGSKGSIGGSAQIAVGGPVLEGTGTNLSIVSGAGGGDNPGGTLAFSATSQTLDSGATFTAIGGAGGSGAANGGNGGGVQISANALTLSTGSLWEAVGGAGGTGTSTNGSGSAVTVDIQNLQGLGGTVSLGGQGSLNLILFGGDFSGVIAGTEGLDVPSGIVTLSGSNTYSGGTTVANAALAVASDASLGTGGLTLNQAELELANFTTSRAISLTAGGGTLLTNDGTDQVTLNGVLSGPGSLDLTGGGFFTFGAVNTYTGLTSIDHGTAYLLPGAQIAGAVTVTNAGTLMGTGSVLGTVTNSGTVFGGTNSAPGTLTVASYTQTANGILQSNLSPTQASLLNVSGAATLNGAVTLDPLVGLNGVRYQFILLTAGSLDGTFSSLDSPSLSGLTPTLTYGTDDVTLTLFRPADFTPWAVGANQTAVALALNAAVSTGSGSLVNKLNELYALPSGQAQVLGQLTGDIYTAIPGILLDNLQFEDSLLFDRLDGGVGTGMGGAQAGLVRNILSAEESGPSAQAAGLAGPGIRGLWIENTDSAGSVNSDGNTEGFNKSNFGFLAGYDTELSPGFAGGIMAGYLHTDITGTYSGATAGVNGTQFGIYGGKRFGALGIGLVAGYSLDHITGTRPVSIGADVTTLSGATDGGQIQAALQGDYAFDLSGFTLKPLGGVEYSHLSENAFTETGSDSLALALPAQSTDSLRPYLGVEGTRYFTLDQDLGIIPRVNLSVSQELMDSATSFATALNGASGNSFTVSGITPSATIIGLEAGAQLVFGKQLNLFANYQGHFSGTENLNTFNGGLDVSF